jgi:hypothetical protein
MKTHARVVVIGGGVVGCSVLYHLTKLGWSDVMLIERSELTSGSTWHAAGGFHTMNGDTNMAALQGYTIRLYKELEAITGMSCGLHHVGGVTLADNAGRFEQLKAERAKHRYMGLDTEIVGPEEIRKLTDGMVNLEGIIGGLYDPLDGHLDPSGTTHAYAKAARMGGAEIVLHNRVLETNPTPEGWEVVTEKGTSLRASGECGRSLGAGNRRDGRRLPAASADGAPVSGHRRRARDHGHPEIGPRIPACDGPGRRKLSAAGRPRLLHRLLRKALRALVGGRHALDLSATSC